MSHRVKRRKVGREPNDLCPCNSGKKYKKCCGANRVSIKGPSGRTPPAFKNMPHARLDPAMMPGILSRMMFDIDKYTPDENMRLLSRRKMQFR